MIFSTEETFILPHVPLSELHITISLLLFLPYFLRNSKSIMLVCNSEFIALAVHSGIPFFVKKIRWQI